VVVAHRASWVRYLLPLLSFSFSTSEGHKKGGENGGGRGGFRLRSEVIRFAFSLACSLLLFLPCYVCSFTAANYYFFLASGGAHDRRYEAEGRAKAAADKARESAAKGKALVSFALFSSLSYALCW
jgi:hypothetical protein